MGTASPDLSRPVKSTVGDRQGEALEREIGTTTSNVRDRDLGLVAVDEVLRAPARAHPAEVWFSSLLRPVCSHPCHLLDQVVGIGNDLFA